MKLAINIGSVRIEGSFKDPTTKMGMGPNRTFPGMREETVWLKFGERETARLKLRPPPKVKSPAPSTCTSSETRNRFSVVNFLFSRLKSERRSLNRVTP